MVFATEIDTSVCSLIKAELGCVDLHGIRNAWIVIAIYVQGIALI